MGNYTSTKETNGLLFKEGKVFNAILNIMENLKVEKNGVELDETTGEVKYRYIKIGDLRVALKPLLVQNKCMIRKVEAVKCFRDRKQSKSGVWINIDVVENSYIIQSMEDCSFVMGTGRGEGSGWGDSAVTLAEADAFKNFIGNTFCLVTDEESANVNEDNKVENTETENETVKKRKRRTKAEIEAEKEKENKKEMKEVEKTTSEEKIDSGDTEDDNDGFLELEYDDDDEYDDEYEEDDAFDKLIKDNLAMMGFTKKKKGKDE